MNQWQTILYFCLGSTEMGLQFFIDNDYNKKVFKRNGVSLETIDYQKLDLTKYDIYRNITCPDGSIIFNLDVDLHEHDWINKPREGLIELLKDIRIIEKEFPKLFDWDFTGRGCRGIFIIPNFEEIIKEKFEDIYSLSKVIGEHIKDKLVFIDPKIDLMFNHSRGMIRSRGSINLKSGLYCKKINIRKSARYSIESCKYNWFKEDNKKIRKLSIKRFIWFINNLEEKKYHKDTIETKKVDSCPLLDYAIENELPLGERHTIVSKNLAIYLSDKKDKEELAKKYIISQKGNRTEMTNWFKSVERGKIKEVSCGELRNYADKYNLLEICKKCQWGKLK